MSPHTPALTIKTASISAMPQTIFEPMPVVNVVMSNGDNQRLFSYYPDEISFSESEFIGLTVAEAMSLRSRKDVAYIQGG
jgi:hypothetical protein